MALTTESHKDGDYARAQAEGVECVPLLVETFGGLSPALTSVLREAADWRSNKLTSSEYDETTWSARTWLTFLCGAADLRCGAALHGAGGGGGARAVGGGRSSCAVRGSPDGPLDLVAHRLSWRRCAGGNPGV